MKSRFRAELLAGLMLVLAVGCRGQSSKKAPIHLNPNMDQQQYFEAQEVNPFFSDRLAMRREVPGTVSVGSRKDDVHFSLGEIDGAPAATLPMDLNTPLLERGRDRYDVFCLPCHDGAGTGDSVVVRRGMLQPPSLHDERIRAMPVGQIYQVIGSGVRNMPPYATQIPPEDRWAIAAYVRALQLSRRATLGDVPEDVASTEGWKR